MKTSRRELFVLAVGAGATIAASQVSAAPVVDPIEWPLVLPRGILVDISWIKHAGTALADLPIYDHIADGIGKRVWPLDSPEGKAILESITPPGEWPNRQSYLFQV